MSGKISWILQIENLDQTISKLKTLDGLLNGISRKGGSSNNISNVSRGTTNAGGTTSHGAGVNEIAIGSALGVMFAKIGRAHV